MHDQLFKVFSIVARMSQTKGKRCARLKFQTIKSWSIGTFSFLDNIVFLSDLGMTLWFRQSYLPFDRNFWRIFLTHLLFFERNVIWNLSVNISQCPRVDLNKKFLPRPKNTAAWKLTPHRSKISKNWNPPH